MIYRVLLTATAVKMLGKISDLRVRKQIIERIEGLSKEAEKQGKPLGSELAGYRSIRAAGQRYRIIYQVERGEVRVLVIAVGIRREGSRVDVYRLAQRLIRLGLTEPSENGDK